MTRPDFRIRDRAELVDALSIAAQVEHAVLLEYLYAAFSCRHTQDPDLPAPVQFTSWQIARELYAVTHEEMDHLGSILQLLAALGAPPVPDVWPFPVRDDRLPFPVELTRLDLAALDRFVATEAAAEQVVEVAADLPSAPDPVRFDALGDLYRAIVTGLEDLGDGVFLGTPVVGTRPSALGFAPQPVATAAAAIATITTVIREGEGSSGTDQRGHWQRFDALRRRLRALTTDADRVSWPCVTNPVLQDTGRTGTTLVTDPVTAAVADIANRAYRALWLLLGGTYVHDWSDGDPDATQQQRADQRLRSMFGARWTMATVVRPLGEILARLPARDGEPDGPTAGMSFEQYGEFRVPAQPDARMAATLAELDRVATDLAAVAEQPALSARWAGPRLAAIGRDVHSIRSRISAPLAGPPGLTFEPATPGPWLAVDFEGWYQARLATGGDPYNDPRGVSGWQFAFPDEPDLDRVLRFQPDGAFLREHTDPTIGIGVTVTSGSVDDIAVRAFAGATVELLDDAVFEGHNGVLAFDGDEPIVPLRLRIRAAGVELTRSAQDDYEPPYSETAALGAGFGDSQAARDLRTRHRLPAEVMTPATPGQRPRPTPAMQARLDAARRRMTDAIAALPADDAVGRGVLAQRISLSDAMVWPFGAVVIWRLRLTGSDAVAAVPDGVPAPAVDEPWWLELLSTGFDQDAACALVRGVLHVPVGRAGASGDGPPPWRIALDDAAAPTASMPADRMGVRPGR